MINLSLRIYIESSDDKSAKIFADLLKEKLEDICTASIFEVERYWKIPEYFGVALRLKSVESFDQINQILDRLGKGWELHGDVYIWNPSVTSSFISESVKWACLELIE